MDGFGSNGPLIAIRAIHFAATAVTAGSLVFQATVARPALSREARLAGQFRAQTLCLAWIGLAITVASGVVWFLLQAASMSGLPLGEAMTSGVLSTVLGRTQFGRVSEMRLAFASILAICLVGRRFPLTDWVALAAALGLIAAIAWTGHAASTLGEAGSLHLIADALHLLAAAAWIGGLASLIMLLVIIRRHRADVPASLARGTAERFSTLGIVSVATLSVTGLVNAWILVGSFEALTSTEYGRLLMLKIAIFAAMLALAAVNRLWLTPQLAVACEDAARSETLRRMTRNCVIEITLGLFVFAGVGMLGTLHPAIHLP